MIVVADTSPLRYLILIGEVQLLSVLYSQVLIPRMVAQELTRLTSPPEVVRWMDNPPAWLEIRDLLQPARAQLASVDAGERDAIELALQARIDTVVMDEVAGRRLAEELHLKVRGTIGILVQGASLGLVDLRASLHKLEEERFYLAPGLKQRILADFYK